jgi:hypothetical protein
MAENEKNRFSFFRGVRDLNGEPLSEEALHELFREADHNKDGSLSPAEFRMVLKVLGLLVNEKALARQKLEDELNFGSFKALLESLQINIEEFWNQELNKESSYFLGLPGKQSTIQLVTHHPTFSVYIFLPSFFF